MSKLPNTKKIYIFVVPNLFKWKWIDSYLFVCCLSLIHTIFVYIFVNKGKIHILRFIIELSITESINYF